MSAHMVNKEHIDYLLSASMPTGTRPACRWFDVDPATNVPEGSYQRGNWRGPDSFSWYREHNRELRLDTADRVGSILMAENRRSVDHRYDVTDIEDFYTFNEVRGPFDLRRVLDACRGYRYQACEHPEWWQSEARQIIESIKELQIHRLCTNAGGWSIGPGDVSYEKGVRIMDMVRRNREAN